MKRLVLRAGAGSCLDKKKREQWSVIRSENELDKFKVDIVGERNTTPPQYFKTVEIALHLTGKNLNPKRVARAVSLSHEKYCSVYNSLRKDMEVKVSYNITDTALNEVHDVIN